MFFNFVQFDLKNGLLKHWKNYCLFACIFIAFFSIHYLTICAANADLARQGEMQVSFSVADLITEVLCGMKKFEYSDNAVFIFPGVWIFFFLLIMYFTLHYPVQNLDGIGKIMLMLSHSRKIWWLSKCVWCGCSVGTYFLLFYGLAFAFTAVFGGEATLIVSEYVPNMLDAGKYIKAPPWDITVGIILIPLIAYSVSLLQMFLTLYIRPIFSYIIICVVLLSSSYFMSPFLIGNYAMLFRINIFIEDGLIPIYGVFLSVLVIVICFIGGYKRMQKMDIITEE